VMLYDIGEGSLHRLESGSVVTDVPAFAESAAVSLHMPVVASLSANQSFDCRCLVRVASNRWKVGCLPVGWLPVRDAYNDAGAIGGWPVGGTSSERRRISVVSRAA
jgi:hypothetical protein